ncbi:phosphoribosyltransferase domain-containing protein [Rhodospirillum rubrum]|uniref:Phosphoribosyltransferase n=1 Tax=Rhodospirillum rubrum (strain ATCC 11170 / ATH 1.1.1 / DSM 467 / LMG 4362 / NCIMB 8255 / S1) TaxID=269796 RepID=Q2RSZ0_RHORT|nr:phosphoribosyltransferase domain-containing protein [Rhodospirillum rubrum]ABC22755.1 Phosphoribosyltransferase [Rhodospirillum rubrum ATCC 11170]AEO48476.1 phosphoribosyltransferase [Rhodospirillum rubrum F11]MBK5954352.1 phosphoribosyltransferase [Rhodospirillum rubrum]QXG78747.1 phosphoribosyltransferase domain-containing protein [Rhodospirillum rubrum]HCF17398.1 phosphoribosyltransferase [Rhodospirillum rubrum]
MAGDRELWARRRLIALGWDQIGAGIDGLEADLRRTGTTPDAILGIARGGLVLATALANRFAAPRFGIVSVIRNQTAGPFAHRGAPAIAWVAPGLELYADQVVVVCDDIAGDGGTLRAVAAALAPVRPRRIISAVLARNRACAEPPDHWAITVDDWVLFPWEPPSAERGLPVVAATLDGSGEAGR